MKTILILLFIPLISFGFSYEIHEKMCENSSDIIATPLTASSTRYFEGSQSCKKEKENRNLTTIISSQIPLANLKATLTFYFTSNDWRYRSPLNGNPIIQSDKGNTFTMSESSNSTFTGNDGRRWYSVTYTYNFSEMLSDKIVTITYKTKRKIYYFDNFTLTLEPLNTFEASATLLNNPNRVITIDNLEEYSPSDLYYEGYTAQVSLPANSSVILRATRDATSDFFYIDCNSVSINSSWSSVPTTAPTPTITCEKDINDLWSYPLFKISNLTSEDILTSNVSISFSYKVLFNGSASGAISQEIFYLDFIN